MRINKNVILVGVAVVLVVGYFALLRTTPKQVDPRKPIISRTTDEVVSIYAENPDDSYTLVRNGSEWIAEGVNIKVESGLVEGYLNNVMPLLGKKIEDAGDFSDYGLNDYSAKTVFTFKNGKKETVLLGALTPAETEYYVGLDDDVYTVYTGTGNYLNKRLYSFLKTEIGGYKYSDINELIVENGSHKYTLCKAAGGWVCEENNKIVDSEKLQINILQSVENMYFIKCFVGKEENLANYGFKDSKAKITLKLNSGDTAVITSGFETEDEIYITVNNQEYIYSVNKTRFEFLTQNWDVMLF